MTERRQLTVDIVSDVVCPWCIIGYRGLAAAAEALADRVDIVVRWHPFELAPATPRAHRHLALLRTESSRPAQRVRYELSTVTVGQLGALTPTRWRLAANWKQWATKKIFPLPCPLRHRLFFREEEFS